MTMASDYRGYDEWKGWDAGQFMLLSDAQRASYALEFRGIPLPGRKVLEIGFGSGSLLAFLQERGAELSGTEISEQGRTLAAARGIALLDSALDQAGDLAGQFDIVAAFDVLEHLPSSQIRELLDKVGVLLRPGGIFIARFPNGASPFGRGLQHGDATHINTLTASKIEQLALGKPFVLERAGDSAVPAHGRFVKRMAMHGRNGLRRVFDAGLRALYGIQGPLHPNLTIVLRRSAEGAVAPMQKRDG